MSIARIHIQIQTRTSSSPTMPSCMLRYICNPPTVIRWSKPSSSPHSWLYSKTHTRLGELFTCRARHHAGRPLRFNVKQSRNLHQACFVQKGQLENVTIASDTLYGGKQVIRVNKPLYHYILAHTREPQILRELREETSTMVGSQMQVSPDQGQFLAMLVQLTGAEHCIDVGVYTGYSSLSVALALPDWGKLVACECDKVSLAIAQKYYKRAGVAHKVDVRHGLAMDTLKILVEHGKINSYDLAFLDADKRRYREYYELLLQLIRPGGLVVVDNVLWHGKVADPQVNDEKTQSLRNFNTFVLHDERVGISIVPIGDGLTLCRKRETKA